MFDDTKSCYAVQMEGAGHVRTFGDDPERDTVVDAHTHLIDAFGYTAVTRKDGVGCTRAAVDDMSWCNLRRFSRGRMVSFVVWDPTWPTGQEGDEPVPAIEARLLRAVADSGMVVSDMVDAMSIPLASHTI